MLVPGLLIKHGYGLRHFAEYVVVARTGNVGNVPVFSQIRHGILHGRHATTDNDFDQIDVKPAQCDTAGYGRSEDNRAHGDV